MTNFSFMYRQFTVTEHSIDLFSVITEEVENTFRTFHNSYNEYMKYKTSL